MTNGGAEASERPGQPSCLRLANTRNRPEPEACDELPDFAALVAWAEAAGVVTRARGRRLRQAGRERPADAARVHARALGLREAIYGAFSALAGGRRPAAEDLEIVSRAAAEAAAHRRLEARGPDGVDWAWELAEDDLGQLLWPAARSAAELLTARCCGRVRECASPACSDLFLDGSRNGARRWCDMRVCGNRAKARRHRERRYSARSADGKLARDGSTSRAASCWAKRSVMPAR